MSMTGLRQIDAAVHKANEWINELTAELDWEDDHQAGYHALRAVLHALRDRLTVEEAVDLAAQLPMLVRGFYYEGWRPARVPVADRTTEQFLQHIRDSYHEPEWVDTERIARAVFRLLSRRVSTGEIADIRACLPEGIDCLWPD